MKLHSSGVTERPGGRYQPHPGLEAAAFDAIRAGRE